MDRGASILSGRQDQPTIREAARIGNDKRASRQVFGDRSPGVQIPVAMPTYKDKLSASSLSGMLDSAVRPHAVLWGNR